MCSDSSLGVEVWIGSWRREADPTVSRRLFRALSMWITISCSRRQQVSWLRPGSRRSWGGWLGGMEWESEGRKQEKVSSYCSGDDNDFHSQGKC